MKILKKLLIIVPIIFGIALFVWMKSTKQPPARLDHKERVQTVRVISLEKTPVVPRAIGYGYVEADRTWEAISEVSGKIVYTNKNLKKGNNQNNGKQITKTVN